jgi:hypothetical protein
MVAHTTFYVNIDDDEYGRSVWEMDVCVECFESVPGYDVSKSGTEAIHPNFKSI